MFPQISLHTENGSDPASSKSSSSDSSRRAVGVDAARDSYGNGFVNLDFVANRTVERNADRRLAEVILGSSTFDKQLDDFTSSVEEGPLTQIFHLLIGASHGSATPKQDSRLKVILENLPDARYVRPSANKAWREQLFKQRSKVIAAIQKASVSREIGMMTKFRGEIISSPGFARAMERSHLLMPFLGQEVERRFPLQSKVLDGTRSFLDIGAWDGRLSKDIAAHFNEVHCIEPDSTRFDQLEETQRRIGRIQGRSYGSKYSGTSYRISQAAMDNLLEEEFHARESLDMILMSHVLYFLKYNAGEDALSWAVSRLKPDSVLVITLNDLEPVPGSRAHFRSFLSAQETNASPHYYVKQLLQRGCSIDLYRPSLRFESSTESGFKALTEVMRFMVAGKPRDDNEAIANYLDRYVRGVLPDGSSRFDQVVSVIYATNDGKADYRVHDNPLYSAPQFSSNGTMGFPQAEKSQAPVFSLEQLLAPEPESLQKQVDDRDASFVDNCHERRLNLDRELKIAQVAALSESKDLVSFGMAKALWGTSVTSDKDEKGFSRVKTRFDIKHAEAYLYEADPLPREQEAALALEIKRLHEEYNSLLFGSVFIQQALYQHYRDIVDGLKSSNDILLGYKETIAGVKEDLGTRLPEVQKNLIEMQSLRLQSAGGPKGDVKQRLEMLGQHNVKLFSSVALERLIVDQYVEMLHERLVQLEEVEELVESAPISERGYWKFRGLHGLLALGERPTELKERLVDLARTRALVERAEHVLVCHNTRLVPWQVKRYSAPQGMEFSDLKQEGHAGLLRAAQKYDITLGYKFSTYATWWVRQALSRALADHNRVIRIPAQVSDAFHKIKKHIVKQGGKLDFKHLPAISEIAEELELSESLVETAFEAMRYRVISVDSPMRPGSERSRISHLKDVKPGERIDPVIRSELRDAVKRMISVFPRRERIILSLRFGLGFDESFKKVSDAEFPTAQFKRSDYGKDHTLDEVGDILKVTRERVRQIEAQAFLRISRSQDSHVRHFCALAKDFLDLPLDDEDSFLPPASAIDCDVDERLQLALVNVGVDKRTVNSLEQIGVYTVGDLLQVEASRLLMIPNVGEATVKNLQNLMRNLGFHASTQAQSEG